MSPVHDYECPECGTIGECFVPVERLKTEVVICIDCRREAKRLVSTPKAGDVSDYARKHCPMASGWYDESLNRIFRSQAEKKRYLKEKGLAPIPEGVHGIKKDTTRKYFYG